MSAIRKDNTIGAAEAGAQFSELLDRVAAGQEVTITRHGSPVARIVPAQPVNTPARRREAIRAMRRLAEGNSLGGLKIRDLIQEGRR